MERSREGRDEEEMMREINVATVRKVKEEGLLTNQEGRR